MIHFNSRQATIYSFLIFIVTIALAYFFPGKAIISIGMLAIIFLTIFMRYAYATFIAGAMGIIIAALYPLFHQYQTGNYTGVAETLFVMILVFGSALMAWYIKSLLIHYQFDRTHMTSLFENATEGIILTNAKGEIILANTSAEHMFQYERDELVGKPIEILIPPQSHDKHKNYRQDFYKEPSNRTMGVGRDLKAVRKGGAQFPVEVSLSQYNQNNEQYVIAFIVDITARKITEDNIRQKQTELESITHEIQLLNTQLEAKVEERTLILKEALEKLEESQLELNEALAKERRLNELKSRFVSMASHEFRTPLSTILSSVTIASKYVLTEENEKRLKHFNKIKESVKHMNELLEDFLSLGKLEENKLSIQTATFAPAEFMEDVLEEMNVLAKKGQQIVLYYTGEPLFTTDKRLLKNTLINLLSNAIKFSDEDTQIAVSVSNQNQQLVISIQDQGMGIPKEDIPYLFDNFYRATNVLSIQGTGLGLPITRRYLHMLQGSIGVESELHKGTRFIITLPLLNAQ